MTKRDVSNEELLLAYYGNKNDAGSLKRAKDNQNVLWNVAKKFAGAVPVEDLNSLAWIALWRSLQYHDNSFRTKFTSSLYRFMTWLCLQEARKYKHKPTPLSGKETAKRPCPELAIVNQNLDRLSHKWQKQIIHQYYYEGMDTVEIGEANGYSSECARQKLKKAMRRLRELCLTTAA